MSLLSDDKNNVICMCVTMGVRVWSVLLISLHLLAVLLALPALISIYTSTILLSTCYLQPNYLGIAACFDHGRWGHTNLGWCARRNQQYNADRSGYQPLLWFRLTLIWLSGLTHPSLIRLIALACLYVTNLTNIDIHRGLYLDSQT